MLKTREEGCTAAWGLRRRLGGLRGGWGQPRGPLMGRPTELRLNAARGFLWRVLTFCRDFVL